MKFILGSLLISSGIFILCIVMLAARSPRRPFWASEQWVGNCHSIVILMLFVLGFFIMWSDLYQLVSDGVGDLLPILISVGILLATAVGVKAMKMKKRIAAFEAEAAGLASARQASDVCEGDDPQSKYRKAAA